MLKIETTHNKLMCPQCFLKYLPLIKKTSSSQPVLPSPQTPKPNPQLLGVVAHAYHCNGGTHIRGFMTACNSGSLMPASDLRTCVVDIPQAHKYM